MVNPAPDVRFLGVFETVTGNAWDRLRLFTNLRFDRLSLGAKVQSRVQILALDETRGPFSPLLWPSPEDPKQRSEQIWMPGVHSDVGGGSNGHFLNDVSLLTMIDRAGEYCTELEWDSSFLEDLKMQLMVGKPPPPDVIITNARPGGAQRLLRLRSRRIGLYSDEKAHPVVDYLSGRRIINYNSRPPSVKFDVLPAASGLPRVHTSYNELFRAACMARSMPWP